MLDDIKAPAFPFVGCLSAPIFPGGPLIEADITIRCQRDAPGTQKSRARGLIIIHSRTFAAPPAHERLRRSFKGIGGACAVSSQHT